MNDQLLFRMFSIAPGEGTFGEKERRYYEVLGRKWEEDLERRFLEKIPHRPPNPLSHPDAASLQVFKHALLRKIAASHAIPVDLLSHKQPQPPPKSGNPDRRVPPPPPPPKK